MELNINYKVEFDNECIDDIMATALEGGITYWCDDAEVVGDYLGEYASEQISRGGTLNATIRLLLKSKLTMGLVADWRQILRRGQCPR